jgi:polar amino acid transport system substrate-binding protein
MFRSRRFIAAGAVLALLLLAACGQGGTGAAATALPQATQAPQPTAMAEATAATAPTAMAEATTATAPTAMAEATSAPAAGGDLLAEVKQRGKLLIATDANYKPQSFKNPDGSFEGFDIDVAKEVAKRLGVEAEFIDVNFDIITAGGWNNRWDMNAGSMTITPDRKKALYFSSPYYYTPASFVVHKDSKAASVDDLQGKAIGVGAATTYQDYLEGKLTLEGETILTPAPAGATVKTYPSDVDALTDLALGDGTRLDAALTALPTAEEAIKGGQPLKVLGDPVYYEDLGLAFDQKSTLDSKGLADAVTKIIDDMHKDGTLTTLAKKYYSSDLTTKK